jgi:hypothetical protein
MSRSLSAAAVAAFALVIGASSVANAELSKTVTNAFRGQLVVTDGDLPSGKNDKDTIAKIKKSAKKEVTGAPKGDVTGWNFHYTAFLSKTGSTKLKIEFLKDKRLAADQQLDGIDPKSAILSGDISIDEDEGLAKGSTYTVQLVTGSGAVVSKTTLLMK